MEGEFPVELYSENLFLWPRNRHTIPDASYRCAGQQYQHQMAPFNIPSHRISGDSCPQERPWTHKN